MVKRKYAIRFPEIQTEEPLEMVTLYSEEGLQETTKTFRKTFDMMQSLADYVIQKNRTSELGKRLSTQREALDAKLDQAEEREQIALAEYSQRLKIQLKKQKETLELEIKKLVAETSQRVSDFSLTVEESLKTSQILVSLIQHEQETLDSFHPYLDRLKKDYENRREYSQCCDMERKAYERIRGYLNNMI